jgi:P-type Cu+ transporter
MGAVTTAGYQVTPIDSIENDLVISAVDGTESKSIQTDRLKIDARLAIGIFISLLLIIGSLPAIVNLEISWVPNWLQQPVCRLILVTPVQFWYIRSIFISGWSGSIGRDRSHNLLLLSTSSAYLLALIAIFVPDAFVRTYLYCQITAVGVTLALLAKKNRQLTTNQPTVAIQDFRSIRSPLVRTIEGGCEIVGTIERVNVNDLVAIRSGEIIPVDGIVVAGESTIDESIMTGNINFVSKQVGDRVIGGTVNVDANIHVRVTEIGEETFLAKIDRLVAEYRSHKPDLMRIADRISAILLPIGICIAILAGIMTAISTKDLVRAIRSAGIVLIIACPYLLNLTIAIATKIGIQKGKKQGITIRNGESLELLQQVNTIVCDRSGTLTTGKLVVTDFIPVVDNDRGNELEIFQLAASLEDRAKNSRTSAIVDRAKDQKLLLKPVEKFQETIGCGIQGIVDRKLIQMGSGEWIVSSGIDTILQTANRQILENYQQQWQRDGKKVVWLAIDREIAGIIGISDPVRPTTIPTIARLKKLGIDVVLLTEDSLDNAERFARSIGIDRVFSQIDPQGKAEVIRTLQSTQSGNNRGIVAAIGNGINDAPALAQADVGINLGARDLSTPVVGDIAMMSDDLLAIITAIKLSRATVNNIKQNLFFESIFQAIGIAIATGIGNPSLGWSGDPVLWVAVLLASAVSLVVNSLRFKRAPIRPNQPLRVTA